MRNGSSRRAAGPSRREDPFLIVFTDLDGTLLDRDTYAWEEARPALDRCKGLSIPVVMVSSKTRAEIEGLRGSLGLTSPFISENGGGIFFPGEGPTPPPEEAVRDGNLWVWSLGAPHGVLKEALGDIRRELGWAIRGFSDMDLEEIGRLTGLGGEAARLASLREYDEPFILDDERERDTGVLRAAAETRGLRVSEGGRFFHLHGRNDKAEALSALLSLYNKTHTPTVTIGLGDSPNDFGMLQRVTFPVLVRSSRPYPGLERLIPEIRRTSEAGPRGWNHAVHALLLELKGGFTEDV